MGFVFLVKVDFKLRVQDSLIYIKEKSTVNDIHNNGVMQQCFSHLVYPGLSFSH